MKFVRYRLDLFGLKIPLGFKPKGEELSETDIPFSVNSTILPVGVIRDEGIAFIETKGEYNSQETYMLNFLSCIREKRKDYKDADIKSVKYTVSDKKTGQKLTMNIVCVENIALEKGFFVEEN